MNEQHRYFEETRRKRQEVFRYSRGNQTNLRYIRTNVYIYRINIYIMFTLRRCLPSGMRHNFALGDNYTIIHRETMPEEFERTAQNLWDGVDTSDVSAFILNEGTVKWVYKTDEAYIMTPEGKTFEKIPPCT